MEKSAKPILIASFCLLLTSTQIFAQRFPYESLRGDFSINYTEGCVPLTVTVQNEYPLGTDEVDSYFPQGTAPEFRDLERASNSSGEMVYTYNEPGEYWLVQIVQNRDPEYDSILITVRDPEPPAFTVSRCNNHRVSVAIESPAAYNFYTIDYGDNTQAVSTTGVNIPVHQYASSGNYTVSVAGRFNNGSNNCGAVEQTVQTLPAIQPIVLTSLEVLEKSASEGRIRITYEDIPQDVEWTLRMAVNGNTASSYRQVAILDPAANEIIIENLNTQNNFFCFQVRGNTGCNDLILPVNEICSAVVTATARNDENQVTWRTLATDFSALTINRDGQAIATITNPAQRNYTDSEVTCLINYCYSVFIENNTSTSSSASSCATAFSTAKPSAIENISVSHAGPVLFLQWPPSEEEGGRYLLLRSQNGGPFLSLDTINTNTYADERLQVVGNTYNYRILYQDPCRNISDSSIIATPMWLQIQQQSGDTLALEWSEYHGFIDGVFQYVVEKYDDQGSLLSDTIVNGTQFIDIIDRNGEQFFTYVIRAESFSGVAMVAFSNRVTVQFEIEVFVPNAFTPDGDGINDYFIPLGSFIQSIDLYIYNRWGELIYFRENDPLGWDGSFGGTMAPQDVYSYVAEITDNQGNIIKERGSFLLLRRR